MSSAEGSRVELCPSEESRPSHYTYIAGRAGLDLRLNHVGPGVGQAVALGVGTALAGTARIAVPRRSALAPRGRAGPDRGPAAGYAHISSSSGALAAGSP